MTIEDVVPNEAIEVEDKFVAFRVANSIAR